MRRGLTEGGRHLLHPQGHADVAQKVLIQAGPGCSHGTEVSGQQSGQALAFLHPFMNSSDLCASTLPLFHYPAWEVPVPKLSLSHTKRTLGHAHTPPWGSGTCLGLRNSVQSFKLTLGPTVSFQFTQCKAGLPPTETPCSGSCLVRRGARTQIRVGE